MRSGFFAAAASSGSGPGAPGVVTNVAGTTGVGQISVTWSAPISNGGSALTDYTVQYSSNSGGTWTTFADGVSTATSTTVTGLSAGTSYTFRVLAKNAIGDGPYSAASAAVSAATTPDAPTTVVATQGVGQMGVTWSAPVNNGGSAITDYAVQYSSDSGSNWSTFADGTSTSTSTTVTGLANNTSYIFRIAAVNIAGTGSYSTASTAVTTAAVPGAPGTPTPTPHQSAQVPLSWTAAANNGSAITDYVVQYSTSATFASAVTTFADGTSASTSATVTGLANGTTYYFRVAAVNAVGTGAYSSISASAIPSTIPDAPATPTVNALDAGDTITWTAPANGGRAITGYYYKVSTNDGAYSVETFVAAGATLSYAAANQYSASTKKIQVRAVNDNGSSGFSTVSANTVAWNQTSQVQTAEGTCPPPTCADCNNAPTNCTACDNAPTNCGGCTAPDCSGGCSCDCGTASRTATAGTRAAATSGTRAAPTLGTNTRTCYRWERASVGSTASGYVYNAGGTTACSAFPGCTAGTCGECSAGACGACGAGACGACGAGSCSACSACSDSFVSASPVTACVYATGFDGAYSGYYSQNFLGSGFIWYGAVSCGDASGGCGGGVNGTLDMRYCGSGAGAGQWRAYGFYCVDVGV